jgi:hypothetical protein
MSRDERRMTVVEDNSKANCRARTPGFLWYPPVDPSKGNLVGRNGYVGLADPDRPISHW